MTKHTPGTETCKGCKEIFQSRNAVFRHLRDTNGACLAPEEHSNFLKFVASSHRRKALVLYGYLPSPLVALRGETQGDDSRASLTNGDDAALLLLQAMDCEERVNRSFGCNVRGNDIVAQDEGTGALSEAMSCKLPATVGESFDEWKDQVQTKLSRSTSGQVRILGRLDMPYSKFNAESDVSHVRMEYLLPADFLFMSGNRQQFFDSIPDFQAGDDCIVKPTAESLAYLFSLKKLMQLFITRIVDLDTKDPSAVMEKEFHLQKRKRNRAKQEQRRQERKEAGGKGRTEATLSSSSGKTKNEHAKDQEVSTPNNEDMKKMRVLRRRRFHNFTARLMAHEFLSYRRLDRFYHRATVRFHERPFLVVSLTGDLFLQGQVCRLIGVLLALARNLIDKDIVDCLFDERYPHLIPTPAVPTFALYAGEAAYHSWEGKCKMILTSRRCDRYPEGFNTDETIQAMQDWRAQVHQTLADAWMKDGVDEDGRLVAERNWTQQILEPWAEQAETQLADYRLWKATTKDSERALAAETILPQLESVNATVPVLFEKVLYYLRQADASGGWPSTTPKRQLVMISTLTSDDANAAATQSLSVAHINAKMNKADRSSAYEFTQGEGGASGSFSVGAMPGDQCGQPKANSLFPELMRHAFELEIALCPHREPSSTIAINRNAQFRPHTDSGAGAGQSTSLIVGLGTYIGGELVVEGEKKDIRYKAVEFNGWTQRHWTMPFSGERFSLVWFTPKGCEGVRGIDLCRR